METAGKNLKGLCVMKKLNEMSRQEVEEVVNKQFLPVMAMEAPCQAFVIPVTPEFCDVTRAWHEALEIYLKEHFDESN